MDYNNLKAYAQKQEKIMRDLREKFPTLPVITLIVMAGDIASRDIADRLVSEGMPPIRAARYIGSYARLDWLVEQYEKGNLPDDWLLNEFPSEWSSCDPDDTDPKFLKIWEKAWMENHCKTVYSDAGFPLNIAQVDTVTVYRGQTHFDEPLGIAWTTDREIAVKFAKGAGLRVRVENPISPLQAKIKVADIYGYLTGRGESEVVLDPSKLIGA